MIVDKEGKLFEDRRKNGERRKNTKDATGGRRKVNRRQEASQDKSKNKSKKKK